MPVLVRLPTENVYDYRAPQNGHRGGGMVMNPEFAEWLSENIHNVTFAGHTATQKKSVTNFLVPTNAEAVLMKLRWG